MDSRTFEVMGINNVSSPPANTLGQFLALKESVVKFYGGRYFLKICSRFLGTCWVPVDFRRFPRLEERTRNPRMMNGVKCFTCAVSSSPQNSSMRQRLLTGDVDH